MAKFDTAKKKNKKRFNWRVNIGQYQVFILALPIFPLFLAVEKFINWRYNRLVWDEARATKVLNKVLPKYLEWVEEDNAYYYCMNWWNSSLWAKAPKIHKEWARKFSHKLQQFIADGYENPEYTKSIEDDGYDKWVKFVEK